MSTHSIIDERLLQDSGSFKKYRPYETQSRENAIFRIFPDFVFRIRWVLQSFLHKKLFRFWRIDVTFGALYFFVVVTAIIALAEREIFKDAETKRSYTGRLSFLVLCMVFSFASRNSLWAWFVGLSYERAIIWHKFLAFALVVCGFIHGLLNSWGDQQGLFLYINVCLLFVFSLWFLRNRFFYYFYVLHLLLICALFYNAYQHNPQLNLLACSFWLVDLALRLLFQLYFAIRGLKFNLRISPHKKFIELSSKGHVINHRPGQFFFLTVPRLSVLEPHTFSAATVTEEGRLAFYIRATGDWTGKLGKVAQKQSEVIVFLNGPYGIPTVDIESTSAKHFILVAGGIGITFIRPVAHWLVDQVRRGRKLRSVTVLWALREPELFEFVHFSDLLVEAAVGYHQRKASVTPSDEFKFNFKIFLKSDLEAFTGLKTPLKECVKRESLELDGFFKDFAENLSDSRKSVKVLCCGPDRMVKHCFGLAKKKGFDYHSEYFEF